LCICFANNRTKVTALCLPLSKALGVNMTYKNSMLYGVIAMGLAQSLSVLYGYLFNSIYELGTSTIPLSLMIILIMAIFGAIPGAVLHFIKSKLPIVSSMVIGFFIFLGLNSVGYIAAEEVKESTIEIVYSSMVYGFCGIFMGFLYYKKSKQGANEPT
jgi:hypothetical protein